MPSMSDLAKHLKDTGMTQAQCAAHLGIDQATVSKLCRRKMLPGLELAVRIERMTQGVVSAASWIVANTPVQGDATPTEDAA